MEINSKLYDVLAWCNRVFLPALATFVSAILGICGVDANTIALVAGIFTALIAFLGAVLQDSKARYEAQQVEGAPNEDK